MENQKSFFIAVVLIVGALYAASVIDPQPTGQFYTYNPAVNIQPGRSSFDPTVQLKETEGSTVTGKILVVKEFGNIIHVDMRNPGGGYFSVRGEENKIKGEVLSKLNTSPAGTLIKLTELKKEKNLNNLWLTPESDIFVFEKGNRLMPLTR